jgi:small subunit ribosomal protein S2
VIGHQAAHGQTEHAPAPAGRAGKAGTAMAVVTMKQLLESGVHFGHQTRRWNPKMKRFIFTERNGIYIIDLQQSLSYIDRAYEFIKETVAHGGSVMFIGTKKQAQETVAEQATRVGMPYVNQRWLGGMLTNFQTVHARLQRLKELEQLDFDDVAGSGVTKKELLVLRRERDKLAKTLGGIREMTRIPSAVWIIDTKKEHIAVGEAHKLGIPVVAILDTNCDPDEVDYKIPGNDDAIRSVTLLTRVIADAVADGLMARVRMSQDGEEKPAVGDGQLATDEPLADWERELLAGDATAGTPAAAAGEAIEGAGAESGAPVQSSATAAPAESSATGAPAVPTPAAATPAEPASAEPTPAESTPSSTPDAPTATTDEASTEAADPADDPKA